MPEQVWKLKGVSGGARESVPVLMTECSVPFCFFHQRTSLEFQLPSLGVSSNVYVLPVLFAKS